MSGDARSPLHNVAGRCPACGSRSLFLASGGYITCAVRDCPDPGVVADLLDRPQHHVIEFGEDGWALQHEVTCFPNLLDCELHDRISLWMDTLTGPPVPEGRYRVRGADLKLTPLAERKHQRIPVPHNEGDDR